MTGGTRREERWEGMAALPPSLPISLLIKASVITRSSVIVLDEMIDILSDEAIFPSDVLSLVTPIHQYYNCNVTSFYFLQ